MSKLQNHRAFPLFWAVQCVGWGFYIIIRFADTFLFNGTSFGPAKAVFLVLGFGLTTVLYLGYRRLRQRTESLVTMAIVALVASMAAGAIWFLLCEWLIVGNNTVMDWRMYLGIYINLTRVFLAWSMLYFGVVFWLELREQREAALAATAAARQAELKMLRYQLHPHFLFNALNSVRALVDEDPQRAKRMVGELSNFLRTTLLDEGEPEVTLDEELDVVRSYLEIEKVRFENNLDFRIVVDKTLLERSVPRLLVYPLVENALKFGRETSKTPLQIELEVTSGEGEMVLEVRNTGQLADPERTKSRGTGTGLQNIGRRLRGLYPGRHEVALDECEGWVRARLRIPYSEAFDA